jgi:hypothetical protein
MNRKIMSLCIIGLLILAVMIMTGCAKEETTEETTVPTPELNIKIKIEATASTWRGGEPYDIYDAIWQKLEEAGFEVVPEESTDYDAILLVDYKEEVGGKYVGFPGGYGTDITCNLILEDKAGSTLFEKKISATTSSYVKEGDLYSNAIANFEAKLYFKYLGEIIASKFGVSDEVSVLIRALGDEEGLIQLEAVAALVEIGEPAVEPLTQALNDEDANVRAYAELALTEMGEMGEPTVESLIQDLNDEIWTVRMHAADNLGKLGDTRAVEPLIQALGDEEYLVRQSAAQALGKIGDASAVEPLIQTLKNDADEWVRAAAAGALGEIGDERAVEPLTQALEDESSLVRTAAQVALMEIQGH